MQPTSPSNRAESIDGIQRINIPDVGAASSTAIATLEQAEQRLRLLGREVATERFDIVEARHTETSSSENDRRGPIKTDADLSSEDSTFPKLLRSTTSPQHQASFSAIANSILEEFPLRKPRLVGFAGTDNDTILDEVVAEVARLLASRRIGKILLVDANVQTRGLTQSTAATKLTGLAEALRSERDWQRSVHKGASSGLEFLPIGQDKQNLADLERVDEVLNQIRQDYQFTCISLGNFDTSLAASFFDQCDGVFLMVDCQRAKQAVAKQAVDQIESHSAKLMGCIALNSQNL